MDVDKGRENDIDRKERICRSCRKEIEDETHFIARCMDYKLQRKEVCKKIKDATKETTANYKQKAKEKWLVRRILGGNYEQPKTIRQRLNQIAARYLKRITAARDRMQGSDVFKSLKRNGLWW